MQRLPMDVMELISDQDRSGASRNAIRATCREWRMHLLPRRTERVCIFLKDRLHVRAHPGGGLERTGVDTTCDCTVHGCDIPRTHCSFPDTSLQLRGRRRVDYFFAPYCHTHMTSWIVEDEASFRGHGSYTGGHASTPRGWEGWLRMWCLLG